MTAAMMTASMTHNRDVIQTQCLMASQIDICPLKVFLLKVKIHSDPGC